MHRLNTSPFGEDSFEKGHLSIIFLLNHPTPSTHPGRLSIEKPLLFICYCSLMEAVLHIEYYYQSYTSVYISSNCINSICKPGKITSRMSDNYFLPPI